MRNLSRLVAFVLLAVTLSACSAQPPASKAPAERSDTTSPSVAATVAAGKPAEREAAFRPSDAVLAKAMETFYGKPTPASPVQPDSPMPEYRSQPGDLFVVDSRGVVRQYTSVTPPGRVKGKRLSDEQLVAKVRAWLVQHFGASYESMDGKVTRRVVGEGPQGKDIETKVEFTQSIDGVPGPNNAIANNPDLVTGHVWMLSRDDGPVEVASTKPTVSKEEALKALAAQAGKEPKVLKSVALRIIREPVTWKTRLVWEFQLVPAERPGVVQMGGEVSGMVDALTGQVLGYGTS